MFVYMCLIVLSDMCCLQDLFKTFGPIVDLRIMSKSNMKGQNGNKVPNYGFIIFERVETVQAVLSARVIITQDTFIACQSI